MQEITVKLLDIDAEHLGVPDQKYSAVLDMNSNDFRKVMGDLQNFGDTVSINVVKGQVTFETTGENGGNTVTFSSDDEVKSADSDDEEENGKEKEDRSVKLSVTEKVKLSFSIK